ncbi:MAG: hypothetical protein Q8M03_10125, partial [Legionella sp.]|nr:hypothetical protein [Legionella sp.]
VVTIEKKYCAFEGRYKKRTETVDTSRKKYICIALIIGGIMGIAAIADFVSNFISQYPQGYFGHFDSYVWNLLVLAIASLALFFITLANTSMDHDSPIVFIIIILFLFSYGIYSGVQTSNERKMKL